MADDVRVHLRQAAASADTSPFSWGEPPWRARQRIGRRDLLDKWHLHLCKSLLHQIGRRPTRQRRLCTRTHCARPLAPPPLPDRGDAGSIGPSERSMSRRASMKRAARSCAAHSRLRQPIISVSSVCNDFGTPGVAEHTIKLYICDKAARFLRISTTSISASWFAPTSSRRHRGSDRRCRNNSQDRSRTHCATRHPYPRRNALRRDRC
jgi:hypothetical protein